MKNPVQHKTADLCIFMPTGLHSVQKLSVTAPAALPAGCSTPSTQASLNSSLPNAAGHCVVNQHLPQQPQEQQTVTQPLRSVHHVGQSEAAAALLQTGKGRKAAADAGDQSSAGRHLEAQGGYKRISHVHVESSLVTGSLIIKEEFEVLAHVV